MADKTQKKQGFVAKVKGFHKSAVNRVMKFYHDIKGELKKVVWPSKEETKSNTIIVLVVVAIAAVMMIVLDTLFGGLMGLIIGS